MKIFISYKFANKDRNLLEGFMKKVRTSLEKSDHEMLTTFFHEKEFKENEAPMRQIMDKALSYVEEADLVLCIVKTEDASLGMNFEIGYSVAKNKKIILAIQEKLKTRWIEHYADKIIRFSDLNDLYKKLESIK